MTAKNQFSDILNDIQNLIKKTKISFLFCHITLNEKQELRKKDTLQIMLI